MAVRTRMAAMINFFIFCALSYLLTKLLIYIMFSGKNERIFV